MTRVKFADIGERASGNWLGILISLGVSEVAMSGRHGPCPGCGGGDRFRWQPGNERFLCSQGNGDLISGDGFDLLRHAYGWSPREALNQVASVLGSERPKATPGAPRRSDVWLAELPVPRGQRRRYAELEHRTLGKPVRYWEYVNAFGELMYAVARFESSEGKALRPLSYGVSAGQRGARWAWKRPHVLLPWNLKGIYDRPDAPVLICEGEKASESAIPLAPGYVVTTHHGGAAQPHLTHWDHLAKRDVVVLPDDDAASVEQWAPRLAEILHKAHTRSVKVIEPATFWRSN